MSKPPISEQPKELATTWVIINILLILVVLILVAPSRILSTNFGIFATNLLGIGTGVLGIAAAVVLFTPLRRSPGRNFAITAWVLVCFWAIGIHTQNKPEPAHQDPTDLGVMAEPASS